MFDVADFFMFILSVQQWKRVLNILGVKTNDVPEN